MILSAFSLSWANQTAFQYQGQLRTVDGPVNGLHDLTFLLFEQESGGNPVAGPLDYPGVPLVNGLFTLRLDFGQGVFDGGAYWMEMAVRPEGPGEYVTLAPRTQISAVPYALFAPTAGTALSVSADAIQGTLAAGQVPLPSGDGSGLTNLPGSEVTGLVAQAQEAVTFTGSLSGDVSGTQTSTQVQQVGGVDAVAVAMGVSRANAATSEYSCETLVLRDCEGSFDAGTIRAQRFIGDGSGLTNLPTSPSQYAAPRGAMVASMLPGDVELLDAGYRQMMSIPAPGWLTGSTTGAASARWDHSLVWDGQRMIVWGGRSATTSYVSTGALYDPSAESWIAMSSVNAPSARVEHATVWTGQTMIVWGGRGTAGFLADGRIYSPSANSWMVTASSGALSARSGHVAVWTGTRMIVWGGLNPLGLLDDGAIYDPETNQWTPITVPDPPSARYDAGAVWAGDRMLIWGGRGELGELDTGAQLIFDGDTPLAWVPIPVEDAPLPRAAHSAVWGTWAPNHAGLLIWGGIRGGLPLNDGSAYLPDCDCWQPISMENAPLPRYGHGSVWTGSELMIYGGSNSGGELASGAAYDPGSREWRNLSSTGNPLARGEPGVIWTGTDLVVFGGRTGTQALAAVQRLFPQPVWYFYRKL